MRVVHSLAVAALLSLTAAAGCRPRTEGFVCGGSFRPTRAFVEAALDTVASDAGCRGRAEVIGPVSKHDRTPVEVLGCGRLVELSCLCDKLDSDSGSCVSASCTVDAEQTCFTPDSEVTSIPSSAAEVDSDRVRRVRDTGVSLFAEGLYLESARVFASGLSLLPEDLANTEKRVDFMFLAISAYSEHLGQLGQLEHPEHPGHLEHPEHPGQWLEGYREAQGVARSYTFHYEKAYGTPVPHGLSMRFDELGAALTREFIRSECVAA